MKDEGRRASSLLMMTLCVWLSMGILMLSVRTYGYSAGSQICQPSRDDIVSGMGAAVGSGNGGFAIEVPTLYLGLLNTITITHPNDATFKGFQLYAVRPSGQTVGLWGASSCYSSTCKRVSCVDWNNDATTNTITQTSASAKGTLVKHAK